MQQAARENIGIDLALVAGAGQQHLAMLLEIHQPIGHLQVRHVEDHAGLAEGRRIFAMRIDHHDMTFGRRLADAVENERGAGRLAGAGRSEQREMLAQHGVDIKSGADILGRIDLADRHRTAAIAGVDLLEVLGRGGIDLGAGDGIAGDAALEAVELAGEPLFGAFAEKIDICDDRAADLAVLLLVADIGEQPAVADADLDLAADLARHSDGRVFVLHAFVETLQIDRDARSRTGDLEHLTDRQHGVVDLAVAATAAATALGLGDFLMHGRPVLRIGSARPGGVVVRGVLSPLLCCRSGRRRTLRLRFRGSHPFLAYRLRRCGLALSRRTRRFLRGHRALRRGG